LDKYVGLVGQRNSSGRKIKEEEVDAVSFNKPNQQQIIINICYNLHLENDTLEH
jgi:hypothetical protein